MDLDAIRRGFPREQIGPLTILYLIPLSPALDAVILGERIPAGTPDYDRKRRRRRLTQTAELREKQLSPPVPPAAPGDDDTRCYEEKPTTWWQARRWKTASPESGRRLIRCNRQRGLGENSQAGDDE